MREIAFYMRVHERYPLSHVVHSILLSRIREGIVYAHILNLYFLLNARWD